MKRQFQAYSYKVFNKSDDTLDIFIDGIIVDAETQEILKNWFGDETSTSYKSFRNQILEAKPKTLNVHVNSPGGIVTDAMAIHDFLVDQKKNGVKVNTFGRGIVASASTYILMAGGDDSSLSENSWFMIHNVSGGAWGDVNMIENFAKSMRKFNDKVVSFYAKFTGLKEDDISEMMNEETWMTAEEALEKGFVKNVSDKENFTNTIKEEHWPYANMSVLNAYNDAASGKAPKENSSSVLQGIVAEFKTLKNDVMSLLNNFKGGVKKAKSDKKFDNIEQRDAVLDMVEEVLSPLLNELDEKIKDLDPEAGEENYNNEEESTTDPKNTGKKKESKTGKKENAGKGTKNYKSEGSDDDDNEDDDEDEKAELEKLRAENKKLKNSLAGKNTKPKEDPKNGKNAELMNKVRAKYTKDEDDDNDDNADDDE